MAKIKDYGDGRYAFFCPGCGHEHVYYCKSPHYKISWNFNGDFDKPTFTPSLLNRTGVHADPKWKGPDSEKDYSKPPYSTICHLFVTNGVINYCSDCTHEYNGKQSVAMKEYSE